MATQIEYAVPELTTSLFLIITHDRPVLPDPFNGGTVLVWRAEDSPFDPSSVDLRTDPEVDDDGPGSYHAVVSATERVSHQPLSAQATRAYARAAARSSGGVLIDWITRERLLAPYRPEPPRFTLADRWLGVDHHIHEERHDDIDPDSRQSCRAVRLRTRGLVRFGVPELEIDDVDCWRRLCALNALRALAHQLLRQHWAAAHQESNSAHRTRTVSARQEVPDTAFADYWRATVCPSPFTAQLAMSEGRLRVGAPDDEPVNDWLDALPGPLHNIAAMPPDDFDYAGAASAEDRHDHDLTVPRMP